MKGMKTKMKTDKQKGNTLIVSLLIAAGVLVFLLASYYQNRNKRAEEEKMRTNAVNSDVNSDVGDITGMSMSDFVELNGEPAIKSEKKNGKEIWVYTFPNEDESTAYYYYFVDGKISSYRIDEFTGTLDAEGWLNQ